MTISSSGVLLPSLPSLPTSSSVGVRNWMTLFPWRKKCRRYFSSTFFLSLFLHFFSMDEQIYGTVIFYRGKNVFFSSQKIIPWTIVTRWQFDNNVLLVLHSLQKTSSISATFIITKFLVLFFKVFVSLLMLVRNCIHHWTHRFISTQSHHPAITFRTQCHFAVCIIVRL